MLMKAKTLVSIFAAAMLLGVAARGEEEIVATEAEGWGATPETAVQAACVEGVKKINGFQLATTGTQKTAVVRASASVNGDTERHSAILSASERAMQEKIRGSIKGYEILSREQEEDGQWHAVVEVRIAKYKTPGIAPDSRRKLVVAPFETLTAAYSVGGQNVSAKATAEKFREKLETFFVQSRRFTILGRQDSEAILAEKKLILRESADIGEYAKIGATLGTDYLVCGKLSDVTIVKGQVKNLFTDNTAPRLLRAKATLQYRILVMPTGQIKWSDDVCIDLKTNELKALRGDEAAAYDALIDAAARAVCAQALGNIYPIRIAKVLENGEVVLGEGGSLHWEGEAFDVYQLGDVIVDAYSKESLGREELRIARIRIARVEAKLSYANVIEGAIPAEAAAANRVLCRPARIVQPAEPEPKKSSGGGVRMPFD